MIDEFDFYPAHELMSFAMLIFGSPNRCHAKDRLALDIVADNPVSRATGCADFAYLKIHDVHVSVPLH